MNDFEWDEEKNLLNISKHKVAFEDAVFAFFEHRRVILEDLQHSDFETRYFCLGLNQKKTGILTVRFTYRQRKIRIFGAGYWRKGKKVYEQQNSLYR